MDKEIWRVFIKLYLLAVYILVSLYKVDDLYCKISKLRKSCNL